MTQVEGQQEVARAGWLSRTTGGFRSLWQWLAQHHLWPNYYAALERGDRHKARVRMLEAELLVVDDLLQQFKLKTMQEAPVEDRPTDPNSVEGACDVLQEHQEPAPVAQESAQWVSPPQIITVERAFPEAVLSTPLINDVVAYRETRQPNGSIFRRWEFPYVMNYKRFIISFTLLETGGLIQPELLMDVVGLSPADGLSPTFLGHVAASAASGIFTKAKMPVPFCVDRDGALVLAGDPWTVWVNDQKIGPSA